jgi:hypothetical protein
VILGHVAPERRRDVIDAMERVLVRWLAYRGAVAAACGLVRGVDGRPRRAGDDVAAGA